MASSAVNADATVPDEEVIIGRLEKRLVGDMVLTYPRRSPRSDKIEAWLADEIRDAIALIRRIAKSRRQLTEDHVVLLDQLAEAHRQLKALGGAETPGDVQMARAKK